MPSVHNSHPTIVLRDQQRSLQTAQTSRVALSIEPSAEGLLFSLKTGTDLVPETSCSVYCLFLLVPLI